MFNDLPDLAASGHMPAYDDYIKLPLHRQLYVAYRGYFNYARIDGDAADGTLLRDHPKLWAAREVLFDRFPALFDLYWHWTR